MYLNSIKERLGVRAGQTSPTRPASPVNPAHRARSVGLTGRVSFSPFSQQNSWISWFSFLWGEPPPPSPSAGRPPSRPAGSVYRNNLIPGRIHEIRYALDRSRSVLFIPIAFICIYDVLGTKNDIPDFRKIPGSGAGQTMISQEIIGNHRKIVRIRYKLQYLIIINAILSIW